MNSKHITLADLKDDIFLQIELQIIQKLISKLLEIEGSYTNIGKQLGCWNTNVKRISKTGIIKVKDLKIFCNLLTLQMNSLMENVIGAKASCSGITVPIKFPIKMNHNLAALVGHVIGDGTITRAYEFQYTNSDMGVVKKVKTLVKNVFNCNMFYYHKEKKKNTIIEKIKFPGIIGKILVTVGTPKGKKVVQVFDIPPWIKEGNNKIKSAFLGALFDDDGSVRGGYLISFTHSKRKYLRKGHETFMNSVSKLLTDLGITNHSCTF